MRAFDDGATYSVLVYSREVAEFNDRWPCSELDGDHAIWFEFDKRNGDLVDHTALDHEDGSALVALSQDAQEYGKKKLGL